MSARCCIVGGGPAGMMLGYLLGRAGVETLVLEKHGDFLRDFRGDTVHPSTLQIMDELGLLEEFSQAAASGRSGGCEVSSATPRSGSRISSGSMSEAASSPSCRNGIS